MGKLVLVEACSHTPFLFTEPAKWNVIREARPTSESNPWTTEEENQAQWDRTRVGFEVLKQKMEEAKPDVILCFGDDQIEQFEFSNFPGFAIYVGEEYEGYKTFARQGFVPGQRRGFTEKTEETWVKVPAHAAFAKEVAVGLVRRNFDLSFMTEEANKEHGIGHAFLRPMSNIVPNFDIPTIPFYINCFYGPQPSANRVYDLGKAIREIIESSPQDLRVAVFGSGGLWHTPGNPESYLNEEFDQASLDAVRSGDAKAFADHFDRFLETPIDDYKSSTWIDGGTGMYNGIGSGTGETRNWIAAAAVADGTPGTIVDYVPVYASPCGVGFAYWEFPE
jgi:hypothetical protein